MSAMNLSMVQAIAQEAYVYAFPMLASYRTMYLQVGNASSKEYVGDFGTIRSHSEPSTPADHDFVTPNNDTPYSYLWLDLEEDPWVLSVPEMTQDRYYDAELIDLYTFQVGYIGTRTTGNGAGKYLLAGPKWNGTVPAGIDKVFRSQTSIMFVFFRTELLGPDDVPNLKAIQEKFHTQSLSGFLNQKTTANPPPFRWIPYNETRTHSHDFIAYLNLLFAYCEPPDPSEVALRQKFASIGIGPGVPWDASKVDPSVLAHIDRGVAAGQKLIDDETALTLSSNGCFGTREELGNNYTKRAVGAAKGLYGNSVEEAWYGVINGNGSSLTSLSFPSGKLPPAKFFWSFTMYTLPDDFLYANELDRYSIGDRTTGLKYGDGRSLEIYLGHSSPGPSKESNWLPAPNSSFYVVARIYGPEKTVLNGTWELPPLKPVK